MGAWVGGAPSACKNGASLPMLSRVQPCNRSVSPQHAVLQHRQQHCMEGGFSEAIQGVDTLFAAARRDVQAWAAERG